MKPRTQWISFFTPFKLLFLSDVLILTRTLWRTCHHWQRWQLNGKWAHVGIGTLPLWKDDDTLHEMKASHGN